LISMAIYSGWVIAFSWRGPTVLLLAGAWPLLLMSPFYSARARAALTRWRARARSWFAFRHTPPLATTMNPPEGQWIRIVGRVLEGQGFRDVAGRPGCVVARYLSQVGHPLDTSGFVQRETHATDFDLLVEDGQIVHVVVDHAALDGDGTDDKIYETDALVSRQAQVATGREVTAYLKRREVAGAADLVELVGQVHRELDASAAGGYRTPALRLVLRGEARRKLLIRPLRERR
jgi:hypothetical protein